MIGRMTVSALLAWVLAMLSAAASASDGIEPFMPDSLAKIEQAQQGKPFVLVLWSLDCVYCKASLKFLSPKARRGEIRIVTVATDSADDPTVTRALRQRLAQAGLHAQGWAFGDASPEQLRYAIDPAWHGEQPRSYWYDSKGKRSAYSGVINAEVFARYWPR